MHTLASATAFCLTPPGHYLRLLATASFVAWHLCLLVTLGCHLLCLRPLLYSLLVAAFSTALGGRCFCCAGPSRSLILAAAFFTLSHCSIRSSLLPPLGPRPSLLPRSPLSLPLSTAVFSALSCRLLRYSWSLSSMPLSWLPLSLLGFTTFPTAFGCPFLGCPACLGLLPLLSLALC